MRRRMAVALVISLVVGGCSSRPPSVTVGSPPVPTPTPAAAPAPTTTVPATEPLTGAITDAPAIRVAGDRAEQRYDAFLAQVTIDLEAFWTTAYPAIAGGEVYEPLRGGVWPVWPGASDVPGCGRGQTRYREVRDNAFYCRGQDFIAFDDVGLFPSLDDQFGRFTVATVLAHEWGHVIQARRGYSLPGVIAELQADCFAGAWMGHVRSGGSGELRLEDPDLRLAITGILEFRDAPGTSADAAGAHGSAFDRLGAFQDGLERGAGACDGFASSPPVVLELPFNDPDDVLNEGDLPLDQLVTSVPEDLDRFWQEVLGVAGESFPALSTSVQSYGTGGPYPACDALTDDDYGQGVVYCPSPEFVAYETGGSNARLHDTIGDFSVGVLFADRWAEALQHRLGLRTSGQGALLQRDCLTGAWVADVVPRPTGRQTFSISPGDLDEAVRAFLVATEGADESAEQALARIGSFRGGLFSGLESCGLER